MSLSNAYSKFPAPAKPVKSFDLSSIPRHTPDWERLVRLDFETYYDADYTLKKLSTSEYVRDSRFKAQMLGIKVGSKPTRIVPAHRIAGELKKINWKTHGLLAHHTHFDGLILSHHYNIVPAIYYDTMSMARGLHSNDIGSGLDEVSKFYGGYGKLDDILEKTKGVRDWDQELFDEVAEYCTNDVDEMDRLFGLMLPKMPADEITLIHIICRMFCVPVLRIDLPRVQAEHEREVQKREAALAAAVHAPDYYDNKAVLKGRAERALTGKERDDLVRKRVLGSNPLFVALLEAEGVNPPRKTSPTWLKKSADERDDSKKETYAFSKDDLEFINLPLKTDDWGFDLDDPEQVPLMLTKQARLQNLIDARLAVKSTSNITRAQRFLNAGANGWRLPVGYAYSRAHTHRLGGSNKMNMQNLTRGGELRLSILAAPDHVICVADSGQIEARVNGWLWGQKDLLDAFQAADKWNKKTMGIARGNDRDAYCRFGDVIYGREITTENPDERFVGKVCVLGLGFQMGAAKLQMTLAKGALGGPPVIFSLSKCQEIVNAYRIRNNKIRNGWTICEGIIQDMARGIKGSHGPLCWEKETIWLPNGMALHYPDLRQTKNDEGNAEWTYWSKKYRKKIYGGLLCENIVQALARIIVMWQLLQIDKRYQVVMTTHDENSAMAPAAEGKECFDYMYRWMRTAPSWCLDLPLNCEGGFAENYSK